MTKRLVVTPSLMTFNLVLGYTRALYALKSEGRSLDCLLGTMVVAIGDRLTATCAVGPGGMLYSEHHAIGGNDLDDAIISSVLERHNVKISELRANDARLLLAGRETGPERVNVNGRDAENTGLEKRIELDTAFVMEAISKPLGVMADTVAGFLGALPGEFHELNTSKGIVLIGDAGLVRGLDGLIGARTSRPVRWSAHPHMFCHEEHDPVEYIATVLQ
ncbi:MAG: rod shape-determining protein [Spirochaetes bacterium]|nr:rod shape-determining protein [Spirochaetota bacterium]